jgi:tetratricopeptide (TPR) repeat protein
MHPLLLEYLEDNLDAEAKAAFEAQLAQDPALRHSLEDARRMRNDLKWMAVEQKVRLAEQSFYQTKKAKTRRVVFVIGLIVCVLAATVALFLKNKTTVSPEALPEPGPITSQNPPPNQPADSSGLQQPNFNRKKNGKILFAARFKPYYDDSLDPTRRSVDIMGPLDEFYALYNENKYTQALQAFEKLTAPEKNNDNHRFVAANCLMAVEQMRPAIEILKSVIKNDKTRFMQQAQWYLALAYTHEDQWAEARALLKELSRNQAFYQRSAAETLLKEIG